jgi:hypothetical protein
MKPDRSPDSSLMEALTEIALNLRWSWNYAADFISPNVFLLFLKNDMNPPP